MWCLNAGNWHKHAYTYILDEEHVQQYIKNRYEMNQGRNNVAMTFDCQCTGMESLEEVIKQMSRW
jgi:hypothetical protein